MAQLCLWIKIRTKQWLVLGASAFQCMRAGFLCPKCANFACLHTRLDQNELHLNRWFVLAKIGIFCMSIAGPLSEGPYSFGGMIKQITCQIRHELSVTIHEISTSWRKTLDGWPYIILPTVLVNVLFWFSEFESLVTVNLSTVFEIELQPLRTRMHLGEQFSISIFSNS